MKTFDFFIRAAIVVSFTGLLVMGLMNVLTRFVVVTFNTAWTEELARYFSIYVIFLGAALATKNDAHPYLGVFISRKDGSVFWARFVDWTRHGLVLLEIAILIFIFVAGIEITYSVRIQSAPASQISMSWAYLAIPLGALIMLIYYIHNRIREKSK